MATSSRRRRVIVFLILATATVALAAIAIDQALVHTTAAVTCTGLNCASGGGGGTAPSSGSNMLLYVTAVTACVAAAGTAMQGIAAFRKSPAIQVLPVVQAPGGGAALAPSPAVSDPAQSEVQPQPWFHTQPAAQAQPKVPAQPEVPAQSEVRPRPAGDAPKNETPWWEHPGPLSS
jgi:hypothetical protein